MKRDSDGQPGGLLTTTVLRPANASTSTRVTYNLGKRYVAFGDRITPLIESIHWRSLDPESEQAEAHLRVLALTTLFQYIEGLGDIEAEHALQTRMDWKYGLHISLDQPGHVTPRELHMFRVQLRTNPEGHIILHRLLATMVDVGLVRGGKRRIPTVTELLETVDGLCRLSAIADALSVALQALVTTYATWLRSISLPHWYERYDHDWETWRLPASGTEQRQLLAALEADADYLLEAIRERGDPVMAAMPEVQALARLQRKHLLASDIRNGSVEP